MAAKQDNEQVTMRYISILILVGAIFSMSACKVSASGADVAAHINSPTQASRAELLRVVVEALNGSTVTIADNALTNTNLLIIEPKHLTGRDLRRPVHFRLLLNGSDCVLVHQGTEARTILAQTQCAAE